MPSHPKWPPHSCKSGFARSDRWGQGSNNKNFLVEAAAQRVVVKLSHEHRRHRALQDYRKEKWCIEQSAALGVPGPSVLSVGEAGGHAFMIETFVEGVNGKEIEGDRAAIWRKLGEYARLTHTIKVTGWGRRFRRRQAGRSVCVLAKVSERQYRESH